MALDIGTVSVDDEGVVSGSGLALQLYDAEQDASAASLVIYQDVTGQTITPSAQASLIGKRINAARANALASAIVEHFRDNVEVRVTGVTVGAGTASGSIE